VPDVSAEVPLVAVVVAVVVAVEVEPVPLVESRRPVIWTW